MSVAPKIPEATVTRYHSQASSTVVAPNSSALGAAHGQLLIHPYVLTGADRKDHSASPLLCLPRQGPGEEKVTLP